MNSFGLFLFPSALFSICCFISITYQRFVIKIAFQVIWKWNVLFQMCKAEKECLQRGKVEFVSDANQTERGR